MNRARRVRSTAFWSFVALVGLTYLGSSLSDPGSYFRKSPDGYYGALTDSFLSGQLSMKEGPDPRLLNAPNPYVDQVDVPRPHDMTLYKGKLYLYFGAAPVVMVYLPWRLLTGHWLAQRDGTMIFCFIGFVLAATLLRRVRDREFRACGDGWLFLGIAVLAWASPVFYLSQNDTFYAVPISAAFCCIMLAVTATDQAVNAKTDGAGCAWLAAASLAYGLAVGSRANYIYGLPLLLLPGLYLGMRRDASGRRGRFWPSLVASIAPAAAVGAVIAAYNYARFDSPFEFGMRFSLMPEDMRNARLIGTKFLSGNLYNYLFRLAQYVRYYPFFLINRAYGIVPYLPFVLLGPLALLSFLILPGCRKSGALILLCATLLGVVACNLLSLGLFYYFGELRYMADFTPAALLLGAIGMLGFVNHSTPARAPAKWAAGVLVVCLAAFSLGNAVLATVQASPASRLAAFAKRLDYLPYWTERARAVTQGPVEMDVTFPADRPGRREPLLSTGVAGRGDIVFIDYMAINRARIGLFHLGSGGPIGNSFAVTPGMHTLRISEGSLYPPSEYPSFKGYSQKHVEALKRHLEVTLDGNAVLEGSAVFYFATPGLIYVGANPLASDVSDAAFTGRILAVRRLGRPSAKENVADSEAEGPLRLHVRFPRDRSGPGEPLVSTGKRGSGDIFFVTYLGGSRIRFGLENAGSVVATDPISVNLDAEHVVDLEMGSLYPPGEAFPGYSPEEILRARRRYSVRLDGKTLAMVLRNFQPSEADEVVTGLNTIGATTATESFTGTIVKVERLGLPPAADRPWGPSDLWVTFPVAAPGTSEPVLVTGVPGKGDALFVKYDHPGHIRFGFDHWSVGGPTGASVPVEAGKAHHLTISMGSLYPPHGDSAWLSHPNAREPELKNSVSVTLDGAVVFSAALPAYDAIPRQVVLGSNSIGASSCGERFTGSILEAQRAEW